MAASGYRDRNIMINPCVSIAATACSLFFLPPAYSFRHLMMMQYEAKESTDGRFAFDMWHGITCCSVFPTIARAALICPSSCSLDRMPLTGYAIIRYGSPSCRKANMRRCFGMVSRAAFRIQGQDDADPPDTHSWLSHARQSRRAQELVLSRLCRDRYHRPHRPSTARGSALVRRALYLESLHRDGAPLCVQACRNEAIPLRRIPWMATPVSLGSFGWVSRQKTGHGPADRRVWQSGSEPRQLHQRT